MPYNNSYNQAVANQVNLINKKYVAHSDMTGQGTVDYTQSVNIGEGLSGGANPNSMMGCGYSGGVAEYHKGPSASKKEGCGCGCESKSCSDMEGGFLGPAVAEAMLKGVPKILGAVAKAGLKKLVGNGDDNMEGGAILGFQEGTVINPTKRTSKNKSEPSVSVGVLGLPEMKAPKPVARLPKMPAAGKVIGNAVKSNSTIEGGSGFASGTHMDTGEGVATKGAIGSGKKAKLTKPDLKFLSMIKEKQHQGKKPTKAEINRLKKIIDAGKIDKKMEGGFLGPILGLVSGVGGLVKNVLGLGKSQKAFLDRMESKYKGGKKFTKRETEKLEKMKSEGLMEGAGWWDDFTSGVKKGFMSVVGPVASIAKPILGMIPHPGAQAASMGLNILGLGKKPRKMKGGATVTTVETVKSTPKMVQTKVVPKAQMPGSTMSGMGKGKSKRAEIVKKIMKEKNMSMIEASKYVKANNLY